MSCFHFKSDMYLGKRRIPHNRISFNEYFSIFLSIPAAKFFLLSRFCVQNNVDLLFEFIVFCLLRTHSDKKKVNYFTNFIKSCDFVKKIFSH